MEHKKGSWGVACFTEEGACEGEAVAGSALQVEERVHRPGSVRAECVGNINSGFLGG